MSPPAKKVLRYVFGVVAGAFFGILVAAGLLILVMIVCFQDGGNALHEPKHESVRVFVNVSSVAIVILVPLAGVILGVLGIRRWNKREATSVRPFLETIRDPDQKT